MALMCHYQEVHGVGLIIGDKFDHLVKAVSGKFTHFKSFFPLKLIKSFVENFETKYLQDIYPVFHQTFTN